MAATNILTSGEETLAGIFFLILLPIAIFLLFIHLNRFRQDLFTINRLSVQYLNDPPERTPPYKLMAYLKAIGVTGFGLSIIFGSILRNFSPLNTDCFALNVLLFISWKAGLAAQYATYMLFLYQVWAYNKKKLIIVAISIIIISIIFIIIIIWGVTTYGVIRPDADDSFPFSCTYDIQNPPGTPISIIIAISILLWDFILSVGTLIAYTVPFRQYKKQFSQESPLSNDSDKNKLFKKAVYSHYKYQIIVAVSSCTTIFWILFSLANIYIVTTIGAGIGWLVSMICLMLMTPYYPNDKWFENLCIICIACNPKIKYKSNASVQQNNNNNNNNNNEKSIDTRNAIDTLYNNLKQ